MIFLCFNSSNIDLFNSPAEWVLPNDVSGYKDNPPTFDGSKVIIADTDHLWGHAVIANGRGRISHVASILFLWIVTTRIVVKRLSKRSLLD